jgi:hypothetical protein
MNPIAAIGLPAHREASPPDAPQQLAREFDAMLWRLLWRSASVPGAGKASSMAALPLAEFYLPTLAAQHASGFGAMALASIERSK